ncbi:TusE/DsrC/DsvC family sulfur relay protein [Aestuariirhabdus litorea]|uniref:Sulfurtransferase n=1 Tax=Aestuariirhabdus litorea TaxID=2528527 RepID=A0A3P3VVL5_9GAMM|nr:TusE/DsrC/DsvC family sulfur relay protein [Aestuariirhabdus litorea]RRJ84783.1 TusE/DsrC/DsvC family sulfur relay protein [Aestuariirhabdus litorea]RWW98007.1 TusE/DsrC/DsvC family sulfur relay protein [Endozoicomonadaceae bacterium GTF-13]
MRFIEVEGRAIEVDNEGYLIHLQDWTPSVADELAKLDNITLGPSHWEVLSSLRSFYDEFQLSPAMRPLVKHIAKTLGQEKGNSIYLMQLFPGSPAKLASRIAGLPKPTNCL